MADMRVPMHHHEEWLNDLERSAHGKDTHLETCPPNSTSSPTGIGMARVGGGPVLSPIPSLLSGMAASVRGGVWRLSEVPIKIK